MARHKKSVPLVRNRTMARVESLVGVFLALLIPAILGGGTSLPALAASMIR